MANSWTVGGEDRLPCCEAHLELFLGMCQSSLGHKRIDWGIYMIISAVNLCVSRSWCKHSELLYCNHPTTTGLYRLGYCTPFMKLSYHAEVLGAYFRGWYSAAPADLLVIVGPSSMASILGTRIPGHFIMPLANQGNYIWDMDGYGWIWWNFWWRLLRWLWRIGING